MITIDDGFKNRANSKRIECLMKTAELIAADTSRWFAIFRGFFQDGCERILKLQDESALSAISSLEYTMLYNNFINRRYVADLFVYDEKFYLDTTQRFISSYDFSDLFVYFDRLWDDLLVLRKRYAGKVSARDVTEFMLQTLTDFYSFLRGIARFAVADCTDISPFINIDKCEKFTVNVGDYMAETHTVYTEWKNKDKLAKWINSYFEDECVFGDYSGLDFSGRDLSQIDIRYTQFRGSTLKDTDFYGSILNGVNFHSANMEGCYLEECSILESDFSYANLKNASLMFAEPEILTAEEEPSVSKLLPARFRYADLTDADLNGANLAGADFTEANLTGADFTGANLTGADFTGATLDGTVFTDALLDDAILDNGFPKPHFPG